MTRARRRLAPLLVVVLIAVALPVVFVACSTTTWLPDSSGLVYVDPKGDVILHRVKGKQRKKITRVEPPSGDAALSPDGKTIVVCRFKTVKKEFRGQFEFYDLKGKKLESSPPMHLPVKSSPTNFARTEMSSDNRHVLTSGGDSIVMWDTAGQELQKFHPFAEVNVDGGGIDQFV